MKKLFLFALALAMTANVLAQFNPQTTPLTLEARDANTQVKVLNHSAGAFEYQINGQGTKQSIAAGADEVTINLTNIGDYVQLWGNQATTYSSNKNSHIGVANGFAYVYGNAMSLVQNGATDFANLTEMQGANTFCNLFRSTTLMDIHPTKDLILPAENVTSSAYSNMFNGCTGLTRGPQIMATTIGSSGCYYMFYQCTNLASMPDLHATTLDNNACYFMFYQCSSLVAAPAIPATTVGAQSCMFMFYGCTALTTAPEILPATTLANNCYMQMFAGCSQLAASPVLPAAQLAEGSYKQMFAYCSNLQKIECYATDITATNCTQNWVQNILNYSGIFVKQSGFNGWTVDSFDGIPYSWTVENATLNPTVKVDKAWYQLNSYNLTATVVYRSDYEYAGQRPSVIPASITYNGHNYAVKAIADAAFSSVNLGSITLSEGLESIGTQAFQNCSFSAIPALPSTLKTIGNYAFADNSNVIGTVVIPANVESIGDYAFYNLSNLDAIDIQSTKLQSIGASAFANTKATEVTIPATVTSIGNSAFRNVTYLNKVTILATTPPTLAAEAGTFLDNNDMIPEIYVPLASLIAYKTAWPSLASRIKANVTYTITFKEYDGTVLCSDSYGYQEIPTPCDPNGKPSTTEYEYFFGGWMRQSTETKGIVAVEGDETYVATYSAQPHQYTITFMDGETTIQTRQLGYGQMAEFTGTEPTRANLEFAGWSPALTTVTGDATYTAVFKARIIFNDEWGKEWQNSLWEVGATPVYSGATPTHAATAQYSYEFQDWPTISAATQNATYTAIFSQTVRKYNIVFKVVKGINETVVQQEQLEFGTTPEYKGGSLDYEEAGRNYYHTGWNPDIRPVDGDEDYVALFTTKPLYTVTFRDCNGVTILKTEFVEEGNDATAPTQSQQPGSIITGWDKNFTNVQSDLNVFAECTTEAYTVTLIAENGTIAVTDDQGQAVDVSQPVAYGTMLTLVATGNEGFVFDKWSDEMTENTRQLSVTSDITLTAYFVPSTEGFENIHTGENAAKVLIDGQILILRGDKTYTMTGQEVK